MVCTYMQRHEQKVRSNCFQRLLWHLWNFAHSYAKNRWRWVRQSKGAAALHSAACYIAIYNSGHKYVVQSLKHLFSHIRTYVHGEMLKQWSALMLDLFSEVCALSLLIAFQKMACNGVVRLARADTVTQLGNAQDWWHAVWTMLFLMGSLILHLSSKRSAATVLWFKRAKSSMFGNSVQTFRHSMFPLSIN